MAEYYGTVVIPTGVRKPKMKASVERAVGILSTWIIAALRNRQFFSLWELNEAMWQKLVDFSRKPFQKKPGNRESAFAEERPFLIPLPQKPFELSTWKIATVQLNYHIACDKMNYSVPYEYIKYKVDVRLTQCMVEIFYQQKRIARTLVRAISGFTAILGNTAQMWSICRRNTGNIPNGMPNGL